MASLYKPANFHFTLTTGVAQKITLPNGSKEHLLVLTPDAAWQFAFSQASIDADQGIPMKSGAAYTIESPVGKTDMWVKQTSGGNIDLRWAYLYPGLR